MPRIPGEAPTEQRAVERTAPVFAEQGWGVTERVLAAAANISRASIHDRFDVIEKVGGRQVVVASGKDGLVTEVVRWASRQWKDAVGGELLDTAGHDPSSRVAAMFDRLHAHACADPVPHKLLAHALFGLPEGHAGRALAYRHRDDVTAVVDEVLKPVLPLTNRRARVAAEVAALLHTVGTSVAAGRFDDIAVHRDAAVALLAERLD